MVLNCMSMTILYLFYSHMSISKKERLVNDYDDKDDNADPGDYTVAVVDNPLYAENEGDVEAYMKEELGMDEDELQEV